MKWIKPSGTKIETNDEKASIEYGRTHGWKEQVEEPVMEEPMDQKTGEDWKPPPSGYKESSEDMGKKQDPGSKTGGKTSKKK